jgi:MSHA biogenesis protein MshE
VNQFKVNDKIGLTFPAGLRSFLRQDPDVMLVGEIRDSETAEIATRAAMTGHMVLSSLHTNDAVSAPARLIDMGVPAFLVASTLRAVLSQRLLRLVCNHCAEPSELMQEEVDWVGRYFASVPADANFMRGRGCQHCNGQGYRGRIGVFQLLEITRPLAVALHDGKTSEFEAKAYEMIGSESLGHQGLRLAFEGRTTVMETIRQTLSG